MFALLRDDRGAESDGHGNRIRQRNAVFASLLEVSFSSTAVAFDGETRERSIKAQDVVNVVCVQGRAASAKVPAHQFYGQSTAQHNARSLGVAPDIVFGGRSHVPLTARRAPQDHTTTDPVGDAGSPLQRQD